MARLAKDYKECDRESIKIWKKMPTGKSVCVLEDGTLSCSKANVNQTLHDPISI